MAFVLQAHLPMPNYLCDQLLTKPFCVVDMKGATLAEAVKQSRAGSHERPGFLHLDSDSHANEERSTAQVNIRSMVQPGVCRCKGIVEGALISRKPWPQQVHSKTTAIEPCHALSHTSAQQEHELTMVNQQPFIPDQEYKV